ncbi:TPA: 3-deoxy-manno-octulosonate cytidylyltransferase [Candidatus Poribacteria bacterium]|jgi:3-deoxy-manno-octulosonate cytidylyltransferase (CMP-KDO synthetase)|nr:3-deoxy-manno-octulosonate cytidylyltransferase [Candidatus Poribacteria bacterium]
MKIVCIIPSRYKSTRLEGKPLKDIHGKPMIQYVYEAAKKSELLSDVIIATDDQRIIDAVEKFGGKVVMTSVNHKTGSDRIAEVAKNIEADIIVNVQGDEPLLNPKQVDEAVQPMISDPNLKVCTICRPIFNKEDFENPNVVKVVFNLNGDAMYFSRSLIPYPREKENHKVYEHIGIYVYRKEFLLEYIKLPQTPLEVTESLEQLRILENGIRMKVVVTKFKDKSLSVDTAEDLEIVRNIIGLKLQNR